jgi:imidazolonepropionase-like amidohydrolase
MIRVLTGATLIDGTGTAPVPDAAVVIDGDRVTATGPRAALSWRNDAEVVDVRGRTVIPGLIDAHDHKASHGYGLATRFGLDEPASTAHIRTARVLAETLAMGYTTVRDGGGLDAGFKLAIEQGLIPGRASCSASRSSRPRAASATASARRATAAARSTTRCSPTAWATVPTGSATWCGRWCAPART